MLRGRRRRRAAAADRAERMRSRLLTGTSLGKPVTGRSWVPGRGFPQNGPRLRAVPSFPGDSRTASASPKAAPHPRPCPPALSAEQAAPCYPTVGVTLSTASRALHVLQLWRKGSWSEPSTSLRGGHWPPAHLLGWCWPVAPTEVSLRDKTGPGALLGSR